MRRSDGEELDPIPAVPEPLRVIAGPGRYKTRCGQIAKVAKLADPSFDYYNCKGSIRREDGTIDSCSWHQDGCVNVGVERPDDIVGPA